MKKTEKSYFGAIFLVVALSLIFLAVGSHFFVSSSPAAPMAGDIAYTSSTIGLSFEYPQTYFLAAASTTSSTPAHTTLTFYADTQANRDFVAGKQPLPGEAPTALTVDAYPNPSGMSAHDWIQNSSSSNYRLSLDGKLLDLTIGGESALGYHWSGLYEADEVVVATPARIYAFTATYLTPQDPILTDFATVLASAKFQ